MARRGSNVRRAARAVGAAGAVALGVAAGSRIAAARRDGTGDDDLVDGHAVRGRTRGQRHVELARLGGRAGADFAVHRARRVFAGAARQAELDAAF
ncbi:MAG TPA: hypothetical protein VFI47_25120, partial [Acidimicrobiales bacterium]|nr:hypothetical protein [Acidimicrobiales bacterium]